MSGEQKEKRAELLKLIRFNKEEMQKEKEEAQQKAIAKKEAILKEREEARQQAVAAKEALIKEREEIRKRALQLREELAATRLKESEERQADTLKVKEEAQRQRETAQREAIARKEAILKEREEAKRQTIIQTEAQFKEKEEARLREAELKKKEAEELKKQKEEAERNRLQEIEARRAAALREKEEVLRQREAARQEAIAKKDAILKEREEAKRQTIIQTEAQFKEKEEARLREAELKKKEAEELKKQKEEAERNRLQEIEARRAAALRAKEEAQKQKELVRQEALAKKEALIKEREDIRKQALANKALKKQSGAAGTSAAKRKIGNKTTVALDIGSRYVKMGIADGNGRIRMVEFSRRPVEPIELTTLLAEWVAKYHLERQPAFSAVSGPEINVQYLPIPALTGRELNAAIKIEAEQILGEDLHQMDSDFSLLGGEKNEKGKVLFIAAPQILGDERIDLLKSVGLRPAGLTTDGIALANGYLASGNGSDMTLLLNLGHRTSNLAVVGKGEVLFVRDILWGNEKMVAEIANTTNFDTPTVLDILEKRKYNLITFPTIIDKIAVSLQEEIEKTISYCQQTLEIKPRKLVVTGGGSQIPSLPEFLAERLLLQLEPWQILQDYDSRPDQKERLAPFCAILAGLSLETEEYIDVKQI